MLLILSSPIGRTPGSQSAATLIIRESEAVPADSLRILKMLSSEDVDSIFVGADVSGDGRVGLEDLIHLLNQAALRNVSFAQMTSVKSAGSLHECLP